MPGKKKQRCDFYGKTDLEKYKMRGRKLYVVFVDLKKAFDRAPTEVI